MIRQMPPLNPLRAFEVAARRLSFTKAAEELYVTPSAVSHQIKVLEESLGVALFLRQAKSLVLTNAGLLDQYRASTSGCTSEALRSINGWDLKGGDVVLYARGAMVVRLVEDGGRYRGVELSSGMPVTLAR